MNGYYHVACPRCHNQLYDDGLLRNQTVMCPYCGQQFQMPTVYSLGSLPATAPPLVVMGEAETPPTTTYYSRRSTSRRRSSGGSSGLIIAGYLCGALSLAIFPPIMGLLGFILGIVNLANGSLGHGIAQILIAATFAPMGMILGQMVWLQLM